MELLNSDDNIDVPSIISPLISSNVTACPLGIKINNAKPNNANHMIRSPFIDTNSLMNL